MNKILEIKFGSRLYGTDTENSDLGFKGIYLPTARQIVLNNYPKSVNRSRPKQAFERNTKDDVDVEIFSLDRYLGLLTEGQTVALDMLFTPENMYTYLDLENGKIMKYIYANRMKLLNKNVNSFVGYARQQAAKYGQKGFRVATIRAAVELFEPLHLHTKLKEFKPQIDAFIEQEQPKDGSDSLVKYVYGTLPNGEVDTMLDCCGKKVSLNATVKYGRDIFRRMFDAYGHRALLAEKNEGVDWKALSHAVRVNSEAKELLTTAFITFPRPDREPLLQIKKGEMPYAQVAEIIDNGLKDLIVAQKESILPENPDFQWVQDFIFDVYSGIVKKTFDILSYLRYSRMVIN